MEQFLQATMLGLAAASILAVAAGGLVLTYTTTGIFNFAHGALGMLGAFAYWQLRFDWGWPAPVALLVVLGVMAPLAGVVIEAGIMRRLADAPEAARVVVTISLLVALLGAGMWIWPEKARPIQLFWGNTASHDVGGIIITYHDIAAFVLAVALAIGLRLLLYRTRTGVAMRAAVDDRSLSMLNGARPNRAAMLAWAIGCACAALAGILMASGGGLRHIPLTLLIVNAYAAAIMGRLRSLPMTFAGAVVLGLASAYAAAYLPSDSALWNRFQWALPVITLFVVLMVLRPSRPRGVVVSRAREVVPRPGWPGAVVAAVAFVGAAVYLSATLADPDLVRVSRIMGLAIIALSLVPLAGFAGRLSLCQMSFAGIGAVIMAHHGHGQPVGLLYAAVVAGLVGAVVAIPAIRLGGLYFALATAAFAVFLDQWIFPMSALKVSTLTLFGHDLGGWTLRFFPQSTISVAPLDVFGMDSNRGRVIGLTVVFSVFYLLVVGVRRSTFGQRLLAMKSSPAASATIGMNQTRVTFAVFILSAAMAGVGGALYSSTFLSVGPDHFSWFTSLPLLLLTVVGGVAAGSGALFAGIMLGGDAFVTNVWPWFEKPALVLPGLMGIALARNPNGAMHEIRTSFAPLKRHPAALLLTLVAVGTVLALRWADVVNGALFTVLLLVATVSGLVLLRLTGAAVPGDEPEPDRTGPAVPPEDNLPWEWVGVDRPFTPADGAELDRALGFDLPPAREAVRS